jgi:hypothetical protein
MALKFFKWFTADEDKEEVQQLPIVSRRTKRVGMDKNFSVGRVKHVSQNRKNILVDVIEMSHNSDEGIKENRYNLWLYFDKEWESVVSKNLVDHHVVFGYYVQSFRNKDKSDSFNTVLTCRFFNELPDERTARSLAIDLMDSKLFVDHYFLKLSNVKLNYKING